MPQFLVENAQMTLRLVGVDAETAEAAIAAADPEGEHQDLEAVELPLPDGYVPASLRPAPAPKKKASIAPPLPKSNVAVSVAPPPAKDDSKDK